jgi:hypothetical protein
MKILMLLSCTFFILFSYASEKNEKKAAHYTINMFVREYPDEIQRNERPQLSHDFLPKQMMKSIFYQPVINNIYGIYNGNLARSNDIGLLTFPRTTQKEDFVFIVTPEIKPTFLLSNTIKQWKIVKPEETAFFQIKKHKDPETKLHYWKVLQISQPKKNIVPIQSIVIIAKPKNIYVPLGATPTTKYPNLVLPPFYAKRTLDRIHNALFVLNIKQFFAPVRVQTKSDKLARQYMLTT